MSRPMNLQELDLVLKRIERQFAPGRQGRGVRSIKYVTPSLDMRTGQCFAILFRGYGWQEALHCQNECRDLPQSLFERCVALLDSLAAPLAKPS